MVKQSHTDTGKDVSDTEALSPIIKAYIDQKVQDSAKQREESDHKQKRWRNSWRSASPITKASLILSIFVAVATIAYTIAAWKTLVVMREISRDSTQQTDKLIDAATQIKNAGWVFSGAAQGINNAGWSGVGELQTQAKKMDAARVAAEVQSVNALKTAIQNARSDQRAYLVTTFDREDIKGCSAGTTYTFCSKIRYSNIGKTPAIAVKAYAELNIDSPSGSENNVEAPLKNMVSRLKYDGLSGSVLGIATPATELAKDAGPVGAATCSSGGSYHESRPCGHTIYGVIEYKDIFNQRHETGFCAFFPDSEMDTNAPKSCPYGNWFDTRPPGYPPSND
jgi:type II secretory pathway pseudopilin PulG